MVTAASVESRETLAATSYTSIEPSPAAPEPVAEDASKPRRTGWWAKRMFGKG